MSHGQQIMSVYKNLADGSAPLTTGGERRRTVDLIASLYKSAATGEVVKAGSIVRGDRFYESMNPERGPSA